MISSGTTEAAAEEAQENHPEAVVEFVAPSEEKGPEVEVSGPREGDRKRHREGHSSRSHKKSKSIVASGSGVPLSGKDLLPEDGAAAGSRSSTVKMCKAYAEKVSLLSWASSDYFS